MARRRTRKKNPKTSSRKSARVNTKAQWAAFKTLQRRVDQAWSKLKSDVKRKAAPKVILRDRNQLLLLLGECNYMSRECKRLSTRNKRR